MLAAVAALPARKAKASEAKGKNTAATLYDTKAPREKRALEAAAELGRATRVQVLATLDTVRLGFVPNPSLPNYQPHSKG